MCSNEPERAPPSHLVPYGTIKNVLADATPSPFGSLHSGVNTNAIAEYQRLQLYDYAQMAATRFRFTHPALMPSPYALTAFPQVGDAQSAVPYGLSPFVRFDPRTRFIQEEPKPQHSYIGLIAMAILSIPEKKMVLSDIYQYILDNYAYFRNRGPGWRNSIRHNLSLNDCFIKSGRSANGKGHYWAIHPANIEDFKKGDFRRRKAQRKVRKHMGLAVPDDDDDSPRPTPPPTSDSLVDPDSILCSSASRSTDQRDHYEVGTSSASINLGGGKIQSSRKRQFDMESLLAPDPIRNDENSSSPLIEVDDDTKAEDERKSSLSAQNNLEIQHDSVLRSLVINPGRDNGFDQCTGSDSNGDITKSLSVNNKSELPLSTKTLRPMVSSSNTAGRRTVQWNMSFPFQNVTFNTRLSLGSVNSLPFAMSAPCWSVAQATSLLAYPNSTASNTTRSSDLPANNMCTTVSPLESSVSQRWQESVGRVIVGSDSGQKSGCH